MIRMSTPSARSRFLDFVLGRVFAVGETGPAGAPAEDDLLWREFFNVELEPNPQLTDAQRRGVSRDYGMTNDKLAVPVRYALLYYFNERLRFDVGDELDGPHERPVVIANRAEFDAALARGTARANRAESGPTAGNSLWPVAFFERSYLLSGIPLTT
jgi:hypothetical protein